MVSNPDFAESERIVVARVPILCRASLSRRRASLPAGNHMSAVEHDDVDARGAFSDFGEDEDCPFWDLEDDDDPEGFGDNFRPAASDQQGSGCSAFAHHGHDHSPTRTSSRTPADSSIRSPPVRTTIPTKDRSIWRWVEEGAGAGNISEEYQSISQLHADMDRSWVDILPLLRRVSQSAEPVPRDSSAAGSNEPSAGDRSGAQACDEALPTDPPASGTAEQPQPSKKKVRHCEHRVGHVPTLAEGAKMGFMKVAKTVEDLEQLMRSHQSCQGTCSILWNGDKVRGKGIDQRTTSAKWVCKSDVMRFAQFLYPAQSDRAESLCQSVMRGQHAFAKFIQFLQQSPSTTCGFIYQAQLISAVQRKTFSYRDTQSAKEVTAWLTSDEGRVAGNSAHKERLRTLLASGTPFEDPWPHGGLSGDLGPDDKRAYVTMYAPHTCFQPPPIDPGGDFASVTESAGVSLTSATALQDQMKRKTNCGAAPKSIAFTMQLKEPSNMMQSTSVPLLADKLALYGPSKSYVAKSVRRYLVGGGPVDECALNHLLQGAIAQARDDGDYAELIEATAQEVRDRMYEIALARYKNQWKRSCKGRDAKMPSISVRTTCRTCETSMTTAHRYHTSWAGVWRQATSGKVSGRACSANSRLLTARSRSVVAKAHST